MKRTRSYGRPAQPGLFNNPKLTWQDIPPPTPLTGNHNNYTRAWNAYTNAAQQLGWTPTDITQNGTQELANELAKAGLRNWSNETIILNTKLARYAGIEHNHHKTQPTHTIKPIAQPQTLWTSKTHTNPTTTRNCLAAIITWHWPTELETLLNLTTNQINTHKNDLQIDHNNDIIKIPNAAPIYQKWTNQRPHNPKWVFTTTKQSPTTPRGSQLSKRGHRASFNAHTTTRNKPITWRQLRTTAQTHNPHATLKHTGRGTTTSTRRRAKTNTTPTLNSAGDTHQKT